MKTIVYLIALIMCAIMMSCESFKPRTEINNSVSEYIEQEENYISVPTVYDVLQQRDELKYALWCDSVYLNIPEQILIHMLATKGTTLSIMEIVEDYWANKQFYHDTILKTMNIQKKYLPDSVPIPKNKTDNKTHHPDTLPTI